MKRILLIGNSPLPTENTKSRPAVGLRTYQFLKPLTQEGGTVIDKAENAFSSKTRPKFKICLVTIALPECYDEEPGQKDLNYGENYRHFSISKNDPDLFGAIQRVHDEFIPDAIVAVNTFSAYVAASLKSVAPMWADLNGWIMAEAQAQAYKMGTNDFLSHYFEMEEAVLRRADKISCVSDPQKFAVLGELAMMGRLCNETFGYKFTYSIPNGTEGFEGERVAMEFERTDGVDSRLRGNDTESTEEVDSRLPPRRTGRGNDTEKGNDNLIPVPEDAFVLLWMGGYNTWVDENTLYKSVADAMETCKNLYFVSTGGQIKGLDGSTFSKFKKMVDESEFKDRFVFLGWVDTKDIPHIYARANLGLNIDRKCTETYTGARNRINEMMKFGLPVLTTLGSEISYEVAKNDCGIAVKNGKHEILTETIAHFYLDWRDRHGYKLKEFGENGRKYISEKCNYEFLLKPLLKWLENPRPAPDRGITVNLGSKFGFSAIVGKMRGAVKYLRMNGLGKFFKKLLQKIKKIFVKFR